VGASDIVAEGGGNSPEGLSIGVILHVRECELSGLEVYSTEGLDVPFSLPSQIHLMPSLFDANFMWKLLASVVCCIALSACSHYPCDQEMQEDITSPNRKPTATVVYIGCGAIAKDARVPASNERKIRPLGRDCFLRCRTAPAGNRIDGRHALVRVLPLP
jgi:hypothetical protein